MEVANGQSDRITESRNLRPGPRWVRRCYRWRRPSMQRLRAARLVALGAAAVVALGACNTGGASNAPSGGGGDETYTIGFSNPGGVGNGWREAMICSARVQAAKAGNVSEVRVTHRDTDAAGQLSDIRDLIAADVDAIVINPASPDALNPALEEAE